MDTGGSYLGGKAAGSVKLSTHFHLVSRSRMCEVIPLLLQYVFMAWYLAQGLYLYTYIYTYIHTYIHTYTHTHTHTEE
jgi:hypothetical protein